MDIILANRIVVDLQDVQKNMFTPDFLKRMKNFINVERCHRWIACSVEIDAVARKQIGKLNCIT